MAQRYAVDMATPGSKRRSWVRAGLLVCIGLVCALLALWLLAPDDPTEQAVEPGAVERVVRRFAPSVPGIPEADAQEALADGMFEQAASGEHGEAMQERVCDLCAAGMIDPAQCEPCEDADQRGLLVVDVVDETGRPAERARIWVRGCAAEQVGRGEYRVGADACVVQAGRRDGALLARAESVEVAVPARGQEYVQLEVSSKRTGGLGVAVRAVDGGVRVMSVMPGTPAAELGLEAGDLIVEVDGLDTRDLDLQQFIATMTGPEGTEVDFVIQYETDTGISYEALSIVRTFLERS
jgi:hypothetical protein